MVLQKNEQIGGYENVWHSDVTWRFAPSLGSVLLAREVPEVGGDTLFCDMYAAYEGLPEKVRSSIDGLTAVHDFVRTFGRMLKPEDLEKKRQEYPPAVHPVVRTHPETGRKGLYVNAAFTSHIVDMEHDESERLLELLYRQATVPEYQCPFSLAAPFDRVLGQPRRAALRGLGLLPKPRLDGAGHRRRRSASLASI